MPKMKTHSGTKKRMKVTGGGKVKRRRAYRSHLLTKKRNSRKRNYVREFDVADSDKSKVKKLMRS